VSSRAGARLPCHYERRRSRSRIIPYYEVHYYEVHGNPMGFLHYTSLRYVPVGMTRIGIAVPSRLPRRALHALLLRFAPCGRFADGRNDGWKPYPLPPLRCREASESRRPATVSSRAGARLPCHSERSERSERS